jgi:DNA polymerase III gamma/tau subunit
MTDYKATALHLKYRPTMFKQVLGQDKITKVLLSCTKRNKVPHALLFAGPSGCGKTTLARILQRKLKCGDNDFLEVNCADFRGIDMVREIRNTIDLYPLAGPTRVILIDEAHQLTPAAQDALLKMLEEPPSHTYFILATTRPNKLVNTIRTRVAQYNVGLLNDVDMKTLLRRVCKAEDILLPMSVATSLMTHAGGSPRKALVLLEQVAAAKGKRAKLAVMEQPEAEEQAINLARALIQPKPNWPTIAKLLREITEDPETLRWMVLGYATSIMLKGKPDRLVGRCYCLIDSFSSPFYDSKKAGLVAACFEVVKGE